MAKQNIVRKTALAGTWYEADPVKLRKNIEGYISNAKVMPGIGKIIGIIAPHAGHIYSGKVAGYSYRQIVGKKYDTVVIIAPNHTDPGLNFSSVMVEGAYETPLGLVDIDTETAKAIAGLSSTDTLKDSQRSHLTGYGGRMEHSIEIQLPFLQVALEDFKIVPIVMGGQNETYCKDLAKALVSALKGKNYLIVASSDLSHFHDYDTAVAMDEEIKKRVESFDPESLLDDLSNGKSEACGGSPIVSMMIAAKLTGANISKVLFMANSGDVTGDKSNVVGYLAGVVGIAGNAEETSVDLEKTVGTKLGLSDEEKKVLRNVVKGTLQAVVNGKEIPNFNNFSGKLGEKWGAFVTLNKNGQLRGCVGYIVGTMPLITTVARMTKSAALEDPRFNPVKPSELPDIEFEISVLTPIRTIKDINEIVVGRDGIIITKGYNHGLLLPQVATEYGWDRETFLAQTCRKAGLPENAWRDKATQIEIFSAEVFK